MSLDLHAGADVVSRDGHKLGTLSRVVVNKDTMKLTHVVVDMGVFRSGTSLLKGWSMPHDRVVPLQSLGEITDERIELTMTAEEFRDHTVNYDTAVFKPIPDVKPGRPDVSDLARFVTSLPGEPGPFVIYDVLAKSPNEVEIQKDSPVWRLKPHQKIGEVERVIVDEPSRQVTALVIRRGFLFSHEVVLPAHFIVEVVEALGGIVRVDIDDEALGRLAEFREAEEG